MAPSTPDSCLRARRSPRPDRPGRSISIGHGSWAVAGLDATHTRQLGAALTAITLVAFTLAAIAAVGLFPGGVWVASVAIGSIASICLLVLFFRPWLVLGVVIDAVLLWATLIQGWTAGDLS